MSLKKLLITVTFNETDEETYTLKKLNGEIQEGFINKRHGLDSEADL